MPSRWTRSVAVCIFLSLSGAHAQNRDDQVQSGAVIVPEFKHDTSPRLDLIQPVAPGREPHILPVRPVHKHSEGVAIEPDTVLQDAASLKAEIATTSASTATPASDRPTGKRDDVTSPRR